MDISSFPEFVEIVQNAVHVQEGKVKDIQIVTGITDYDRIFNHSIQKDVKGNNICL